MPCKFFMSMKTSSPKGNTLKKPESVKRRASPPISASQSEHPPIIVNGHFVDGDKFEQSYVWNDLSHGTSGEREPAKKSDALLTVNEWIKESMHEDAPGVFPNTPNRPKIVGCRESVIHRTNSNPYHAGLLEEKGTGGGANVVPRELEKPQSSKPEPLLAASVVPDPLANDESPERAAPAEQVTPPMLDLLLSQHDTSSRYFTCRFRQMLDIDAPSPSSSVSSSPLPGRFRKDISLRFPDFDPHVYELYKIWLHNGTLPTWSRETGCSSPEQNPKYTWQICWPLMNAVILGTTMGEPECTDRIMDMLETKVVKAVCADVDTISHIFSEDNIDAIPHILKQFVIDRCLDSGLGGFRSLELAELPVSFVHLALKTALQRLSNMGQVPLVPGCKYHTHETFESCYTRHLTREQLRKDGRLESQREKSRTDAQEVERNVRENGIRSIDWQIHRAEAKQVMCKNIKASLVGVSAPNNARPDEVIKDATTSLIPDTVDEESSPIVEGLVVGRGPPKVTGDLFGTAQTNGAVNEISTGPPSHSPVPAELQGSVAYVMQHLESNPAYQGDPLAVDSEIELATPTNGAGSSNSPHLSTTSTESQRERELREGLNMVLEVERLATIPGAFPVSRAGSLRCVNF